MDAAAFDALARRISRRSALAGFAGLLAVAKPAGARRRRRRHRDRCVPDCPDGLDCIDGACACGDGGQPCGDACCEAGLSCRDGACLPDEPDQSGACLGQDAACNPVFSFRRCCQGLWCTGRLPGNPERWFCSTTPPSPAPMPSGRRGANHPNG